MLELNANLSELPYVGPRFAQNFARLGIHTVRELLYHFPSRYEDFSQIYPIDDLEPGQQATIQGVIEEVRVRHTWKKHLTIVEAFVTDDSGRIRVVWFNQPFLKNVLRPGRLANFSGKVAASEEDLYLSHPTYEIVGQEETKHTGRLVPVYPETRGLTSKGIRFILKPILDRLPKLPEWLPPEVRQEHDLPEINEALHTVHFPEAIEDAHRAKHRFAFEDLFLLQVMNLSQKMKLAREKAPGIPADIEILKQMLEELPFELTVSQKRSLWEILRDLERTQPMNRLLQGDVGSGKTVVAALAALLSGKQGFQSAIMAPTEVLARQHYLTFKKLSARLSRDHQVPIGLLTGNESRIFYETDVEANLKKSEFHDKIRTGEIKIAIGTHALIQKSIEFRDLGLVIIDEQHRFGVEQRAALARRSEHNDRTGKTLPHFLSMSATPIPRTLMLTVFGDLDISTIDELPAGRKEIITKIVAPQDRMKAYGVIRGQIKKGRQAFVICPRIDPSEVNEKGPQDPRQAKLWEVKSVKEEFEKLSTQIFPDLTVAMLHGQMKAKEKESIMSRFRDGEIDILVSTSVIEVGVDVPNATIMMIEGADRFGLAQLYQFRGRVGRGEHQSFCFLFTDSSSTTTAQRLNAIATAKNGFELAERDLELRGPGEFIGQKQTGLPDVAMRGLQDVQMIKASREAAQTVIDRDPGLKQHPALRAKLDEFQKGIHLE